MLQIRNLNGRTIFSNHLPLAAFSRKTRPIKKQKGNGIEDEAFNPPDSESEHEDGTGQKHSFAKSGNRIYIPRTPLDFDEDKSLLVYQASSQFMKIPRLTVPGYFLSFASAIVMMDAFATLHIIKGVLFSIPFLTFLGLSTFMTQHASLIISRIEL